jgi:hypothetical protein
MQFSGDPANLAFSDPNAALPLFFLFFVPHLLIFTHTYHFGGIIMTMFQRKRIKLIRDAIDKTNAAADADVDNLLERFIASKWTAAISVAVLLAGAVFAVVALLSLF